MCACAIACRRARRWSRELGGFRRSTVAVVRALAQGGLIDVDRADANRQVGQVKD